MIGPVPYALRRLFALSRSDPHRLALCSYDDFIAAENVSWSRLFDEACLRAEIAAERGGVGRLVFIIADHSLEAAL